MVSCTNIFLQAICAAHAAICTVWNGTWRCASNVRDTFESTAVAIKRTFLPQLRANGWLHVSAVGCRDCPQCTYNASLHTQEGQGEACQWGWNTEGRQVLQGQCITLRSRQFNNVQDDRALLQEFCQGIYHCYCWILPWKIINIWLCCRQA